MIVIGPVFEVVFSVECAVVPFQRMVNVLVFAWCWRHPLCNERSQLIQSQQAESTEAVSVIIDLELAECLGHNIFAHLLRVDIVAAFLQMMAHGARSRSLIVTSIHLLRR